MFHPANTNPDFERLPIVGAVVIDPLPLVPEGAFPDPVLGS